GSGQLFDLVFVIWHHIFSPFPYFLFYLFAVEREKTFISIYIYHHISPLCAACWCCVDRPGPPSNSDQT
ncbi:hypothetical protein, partial [Geobacillus stearothermophilus]|nr:hypothetical protein [Geobacillus stearothermophilus]